MKHTPGPWKWWTSNSWSRLKRDDHGITQNVLEPYVCRDGHPDLSISQEDMALIAAAPDLLEALEKIAAGLANTKSIKGQWMTRIKKDEAWEIARAAIAKATGEP